LIVNISSLTFSRMPEPISLIFGLIHLAMVKGGAAIGTKAALMHTAIATEGAVSTAATVGGAATAVGSGAKFAYDVHKEEEKQKNAKSNY
jgi:hypothetical protein